MAAHTKSENPTRKRDVTVVQRRLKAGTVFTAGSRPIALVEPDMWSIRIVNTEISNDHLYTMLAEHGWVYLEAADLAVKPEEIGFRDLDGRLVRGDNGHEVLMKMRRKDYAAVQRMKEDQNKKNTFGDKAVKQAILGAAASEPDGGRGAEFLEDALKRVSIVDSRERVNLEE